jgi:hypothetical protein
MNWCPKPAPTDPALVLEKVLPLVREKTHVSIAAWVAEQNAQGHVCQCGCGQRIEVRPHHRKIGVPRFIANHHQQLRKGEPRTPHQEGLLTVREAAEALGVREGILRRLDAEVFAGTSREGVRFFTPGDIDTLRKVLEERRAKRKGSGASDGAPEPEETGAEGQPRLDRTRRAR